MRKHLIATILLALLMTPVTVLAQATPAYDSTCVISQELIDTIIEYPTAGSERDIDHASAGGVITKAGLGLIVQEVAAGCFKSGGDPTNDDPAVTFHGTRSGIAAGPGGGTGDGSTLDVWWQRGATGPEWQARDNADTGYVGIDVGSLQVGGTEVVDSSRNVDAVSLQIGGTEVVASNRGLVYGDGGTGAVADQIIMYGADDGAGNYNRLEIEADTTFARIRTFESGSGGNMRIEVIADHELKLGAQGSSKWTISGNDFAPSDVSDNQRNVGTASNRIAQLHAGTALNLGDNPATAGLVRIGNGYNVQGRNAANSANFILFHLHSDDDLYIGTNNTGSGRVDLRIADSAGLIGFFGATPVAQPSSTGEATGFTAGSGTGVNDDSTFTGNLGATAYTISDLVKHLKNLGLIAQ